jgi:hypothetical protein
MTDDVATTMTNDQFEPEQKRKLFIDSLSYLIEENVFHDYWTQFGAVMYVNMFRSCLAVSTIEKVTQFRDATILRDRDGHLRGFIFVTFAQSISVDAVMQARPHIH